MGGIIIVFAREPVPGHTKTRLIPVLGDIGASRLHESMILHALENVSSFDTSSVELYAGSIDSPFLEACARQYRSELRLQQGNDLGQRMYRACQDTLASAEWVILVGTDCPTMTRGDIHDAIEHLRSGVDVVLGPAYDGGYYLVGLRRNDPSLFDDMPWGSEHVFEQTTARIDTLGWTFARLATRHDIDRPEDLVHLPESLRAGVNTSAMPSFCDTR